MHDTGHDRYVEHWAKQGHNVGEATKYAPLKELINNTVFLKLTFKEFYKGRSANGALFEDSEGLCYKMQMEDFEKVLQTGCFGTRLVNNKFPLAVSAEFKVYARGPHHFIKAAL